jgi:sigma-B regulation protein RsbU (phosphoserine phosphatase)
MQVLPVAGGRNTIFVEAPVTPALLDKFPSKLGPIQLTLLAPTGGNRGGPPPFGGGRGENGPGQNRGPVNLNGANPSGGNPNAGNPNGGSANGGNPNGGNPNGGSANGGSPNAGNPNAGPPPGRGQYGAGGPSSRDLTPPTEQIGSALEGTPPAGASDGRGRGPRATYTINGVKYIVGQAIPSGQRALQPSRFFGDVRVAGSTTFKALRVQRGGGSDLPVVATYSFRLSAVNADLLTSLGDFAPDIVDLLYAAGIAFLILEMGAFVTGVVLTRTITHSVADLYDATVRIRSGDLAHRIHIARHDQLGALADSFNEMTGSVAELIDEQRQRQKLENEVSIAREVQLQLFPKKLPTIPGLELAAICRPARSVSGDYYDVIPLSGTRVGIAVADISGKGIFASLLMASVQAALRSAASMNGTLDTAKVVSRLNQQLFQTTSDDRYATLFYGVYDTETRILNYTNAGHLSPLLVTDGKVQTLAEGGTVIGLIEDATYKQGTVQVSPGSLLMVFSDGLTEPENVFGEEYGVERLQEELLRERNEPANKLAEDLIDGAERWSGSAEQADDMTVVIARMA